jgi:hypothetical protein
MVEVIVLDVVDDAVFWNNGAHEIVPVEEAS